MQSIHQWWGAFQHNLQTWGLLQRRRKATDQPRVPTDGYSQWLSFGMEKAPVNWFEREMAWKCSRSPGFSKSCTKRISTSLVHILGPTALSGSGRRIAPHAVTWCIPTSGARFRKSQSQFQSNSKNLSSELPNFCPRISYPNFFPIFHWS